MLQTNWHIGHVAHSVIINLFKVIFYDKAIHNIHPRGFMSENVRYIQKFIQNIQHIHEIYALYTMYGLFKYTK